ncbi:hypothetical protein GCM10009860_10940 [Microbacterium mitrae]
MFANVSPQRSLRLIGFIDMGSPPMAYVKVALLDADVDPPSDSPEVSGVLLVQPESSKPAAAMAAIEVAILRGMCAPRNGAGSTRAVWGVFTLRSPAHPEAIP